MTLSVEARAIEAVLIVAVEPVAPVMTPMLWLAAVSGS